MGAALPPSPGTATHAKHCLPLLILPVQGFCAPRHHSRHLPCSRGPHFIDFNTLMNPLSLPPPAGTLRPQTEMIPGKTNTSAPCLHATDAALTPS